MATAADEPRRSSSPSGSRRRTSTASTPLSGSRGPRLRRLEPPVRDAHRQGRGRLRHDPRASPSRGRRRTTARRTRTRCARASSGRTARRSPPRTSPTRQPLARGGVAQLRLDRAEPHGEGDRRPHRRDHELGARSEAPDHGRLHPPEAHLGEARRQGDHEVRRRRTASAPARSSSTSAKRGQFWPHEGEPELLGRERRRSTRSSSASSTTPTRWSPRSRTGEIDAAHDIPTNAVERPAGRRRASSSSRASRAASTSSRSTAATGLKKPHPALLDRRGSRWRSPTRSTSRRSSTACYVGPRHGRRTTISPCAESRRGSPRSPPSEQFDVRPRQGEPDPRRGRLQGHGRRRRPRDAGRRRAAELHVPTCTPSRRPRRRSPSS